MFISARRSLTFVLPLAALFATACGDTDDDFIPDPYGDVDIVIHHDDDAPADDDGDFGLGDGDASGDVDNGDGDSAPPPPVYGLDARPSQQTCLPFTAPPVTNQIGFVDRFPQVRFNAPVSMSQRPGDNSRIYINQRDGHIYSFPNDPTATNADKVLALDLSDVEFTGWDCSTASLVFPADFATYGAAYVNYCYMFPDGGNNPHIQVRLSRFYSTDGGLTFDRASEQVLVAINYLESTDDYCGHSQSEDGLHAGDAAHFGPDGYLYWTVGDGGPQGRCGGREAQHLSQLRGKMLRLDVSDLTRELDASVLGFNEGWQYTNVDIPPTNPFYGTGVDPNPTKGVDEVAGVVQPLIYAYGFRNPWQWNFDPADNTIWLGDVGNNTFEEVNRDIVAGGNYGWGYYEGYYCANGWTCATEAPASVHFPLYQVLHGPQYDEASTAVADRIPSTDYGSAMTGGLVYRGTDVPSYTGSYFFGDSSRARIWVIRNVDAIAHSEGSLCDSTADCGTGLVCVSRGIPYESGYPAGIVSPQSALPRCTAPHELVQTGVAVASFAHDQNNEIYGIFLNGYIGMLRATPASGGGGGPPSLLSQTGCFEVADDAGTPTVGEPVTDLIPFAPAAELWSDGATKRRWMTVPDAATITLDASGDFDFPLGTMLVKEFSLDGQKVETRFLTRQVADGRWAAYTYQWNDQQTDATLVTEIGADKSWPVGAGTQAWHYPGRSQCFQCHNTVDKTVLGPEAMQLNHDITYPATGKVANQMVTLEHIGVIDTASAPAPWASLAAISDTSRNVPDRARSYLHANCSICHRPDGPTFTPLDLRYQAPFVNMKVCNAPPSISQMEDLIEPGTARILAPADPDSSQLYVRMQTTIQGYRMPPLARTIPHDVALQVIEDWINSISTCP